MRKVKWTRLVCTKSNKISRLDCKELELGLSFGLWLGLDLGTQLGLGLRFKCYMRIDCKMLDEARM